MSYYKDNHNLVASVFLEVNLTGLLQIVFVVLKLCGVINWHWALVLLPMEIDIGLSILLAIVYFAIIGIMALKEAVNNKKIAKIAAKERDQERLRLEQIKLENEEHKKLIAAKLQVYKDEYDNHVFNKHLPVGASRQEHYRDIVESILFLASWTYGKSGSRSIKINKDIADLFYYAPQYKTDERFNESRITTHWGEVWEYFSWDNLDKNLDEAFSINIDSTLKPGEFKTGNILGIVVDL